MESAADASSRSLVWAGRHLCLASSSAASGLPRSSSTRRALRGSCVPLTSVHGGPWNKAGLRGCPPVPWRITPRRSAGFWPAHTTHPASVAASLALVQGHGVGLQQTCAPSTHSTRHSRALPLPCTPRTKPTAGTGYRLLQGRHAGGVLGHQRGIQEVLQQPGAAHVTLHVPRQPAQCLMRWGAFSILASVRGTQGECALDGSGAQQSPPLPLQDTPPQNSPPYTPPSQPLTRAGPGAPAARTNPHPRGGKQGA